MFLSGEMCPLSRRSAGIPSGAESSSLQAADTDRRVRGGPGNTAHFSPPRNTEPEFRRRQPPACQCGSPRPLPLARRHRCASHQHEPLLDSRQHGGIKGRQLRHTLCSAPREIPRAVHPRPSNDAAHDEPLRGAGTAHMQRACRGVRGAKHTFRRRISRRSE